MSKEPLFVAVSNQKGGVGKSALTVVLSSYLHFEKNLNVAIIDCDSPQHSLVRMRERDKKAIANSAYFQQLLQQQWNRVPKKAYPIVGSTSEKAREAADELAASGDYDLIFVDLPGLPPLPILSSCRARSLFPRRFLIMSRTRKMCRSRIFSSSGTS